MSTDWLNHHHGHAHSPVHRMPAVLKLGAALAIIIGTVIAPLQWTGWFVGVGAVLGISILLSRLPLIFLLKRLLVLSPFVLGVTLVNAFQPSARFQWQAVALKSGLCLLTVILVSNTTPFGQILRVLKLVRVPMLLITTIALMHRYLFVLVDEAERMRRARLSRTFVPSRGFHWRSLATVVGQLFIRASERAERIYDAMCARGWK
ncbi:MAG TPA: CbiQ family ECF transporter T component [Verrucomicrobiae bacterium]|jgi:cobalt/nickel transport system permease protein|nr:CbiQ family ECF transporter T component [Verrucomicrobiae bacterium]